MLTAATTADAELVSLREEVDALASELLSQYEEITLLYDVSHELGVVLDLEAASGTALVRSMQVVPASLGLILLGDDPDQLRVVASVGEVGPNGESERLARAAARVAIHRGAQLIVHAGGSLEAGGAPVHEPVLAAPLAAGDPTGASPDPVGALVFVGRPGGERFSASDAQLSSVVARQLAQGVANARVIGQLREKERLESELGLAAEIQRSLLPRRAPYVPGATLAGRCLPAAQVGGDYYDFVAGPSGAVHAVVGDVTGHGLGPGLIMVMARSVFRAELRSRESLAEALVGTNAVMWDDLVATEVFITLFALRYEPGSRQLHYVNGGHHPALLRRRDGSVLELTSDGMPFGLLSSAPYEERMRVLEPGDAVLVFSDGVVESCAPEGDEYGTPRLRALLAAAGTGTADDLVARVLADLRSFHGPGPQEDDVTVVALRVAAHDESDDR